jgi:CheY-like chemotaxis protein
LQQIKTASERAAELTQQLLTFSRRNSVNPRIVDVNAVIGDMNKMLRRLIGEHIELVTLFHQSNCCIKIDSAQFEQVILNLAVNARDAMPKGGKLIIETSYMELDLNHQMRHQQMKTGQYVLVAVSDTGQGMDKETQQHIFEPFFTTKEKGKGTGLGLATSYAIIKQFGGQIFVYSEPDYGTTMKILIPAVDGEMKEKIPKAVSMPARGGKETLLLVEDESLVRDFASQVLREKGYNVIEMQNGGEAVYFFEKNLDRKVDLVITDVVMPQIGGKELAEKIKKVRPRVKVLFTSGYTNGVMIQHGIIERGINFLPKPFSPAQLALRVREVLDK